MHHHVALMYYIVLYLHYYVRVIHSNAVQSGLFDFAVCAYVTVCACVCVYISAAGLSSPRRPQSSIFHHPPDSAQESPKPKVPFSSFASSAIQQTLSIFLISFFYFQAAAWWFKHKYKFCCFFQICFRAIGVTNHVLNTNSSQVFWKLAFGHLIHFLSFSMRYFKGIM